MAFLFSVFVVALMIAGLSFHRYWELEGRQPPTSVVSSMGKPRTVDMEKIRLLMKQGILSDKEARFYTTSPTDDGKGPKTLTRPNGSPPPEPARRANTP